MTKKSIRTLKKCPYIIFALKKGIYAFSKPLVLPNIRPRNGFIISVRNDETTLVTEPPKINPTANPTTPRSLINSTNPFIRI